MGQLNLKRRFILGEEWIYFKFYSGAQTADRILERSIIPSVDFLLKGKIDQWFFIRYADPDLHLRIRMHCERSDDISSVIQTIYSNIKDFTDRELIWKVQTDTYNREIERYGLSTMKLSEQLFFHDSTLFLNILPQLRHSKGEVQRWQFALKSIDCLLDCFQFGIEDKYNFMKELSASYGKEFKINRFLKKQLDKKYALERSCIELSMNSTDENEIISAPIMKSLFQHEKIVRPLAEEILDKCVENQKLVSTYSLVASYVHMTMNRLFRSQQRLHELVVYDFLYRYYRSTLARKRETSKRSRMKIDDKVAID